MRRIHHDAIDSTNSEAQRLSRCEGAEPLLVTAARQTAGRGRDGRVWQSPVGGAWMSLLWPVRRAGEDYAALPLIVGLAVRRTVAGVVNAHPADAHHVVQIKWPNDVLLDERKVAGILCETVHAQGRLTHVICGVGVNVDFPVESLHGQLRHPPTTLSATLGRGVSVPSVTDRFQAEAERLLTDFDRAGLTGDAIEEARTNLACVGSQQTWQFGDEEITGVVDGIDADGRLLLNVGGVLRAFNHGELSRIPFSKLAHLV